MNYIGSKLKLSSWIFDTVKQTCGEDLSQKTFCDIFAGTGIIGRTFKTNVHKVISNDVEYYSYVLNRNYIQNHKTLKRADQLINLLNDENKTPLLKGKIFTHYAAGGGENRQYFSDENAQKIDSIRTQIENWKFSIFINDDEYYFLLASLLECADKVANTASVYGAFLKNVKKSAQQQLVLKPATFDLNENEHKVFQKDANTLIKEISGDILYMDPPYNARQYGANYHMLNTIALYDDFIPKGKTGLRDYQKSKYCSKNTVNQEFEELIRNANFKYIFLSYNNEGLMSLEEVQSIMKKYGKYSLEETSYQRFRADKNSDNRNYKADSTVEYLHILEK